MNILLQLLKDNKGATMIEYGLIVAIISVAAIITTGFAGKGVNTSFSKISSTLSSANR